MPTPDTLDTLRAALRDEREHLRRQLGELGVGGEGMAFDENFADSGQVAAEKGEHRVLANSIQDSLVDIDHALEKLDQGGYGLCERCGMEIGQARLEAMPATRFCIACASSR
ncbi:MAG: TraR/DksA C4-type zinc finger protein [Actinomycetota bacterium]|jgi:DnaK suppressor protein|nr:TraR/DksA C4-type zinc finger protein [Actinomycetota bacterium]